SGRGQGDGFRRERYAGRQAASRLRAGSASMSLPDPKSSAVDPARENQNPNPVRFFAAFANTTLQKRRAPNPRFGDARSPFAKPSRPRSSIYAARRTA